jgi:hypothetical protein
VLRGRLSRVGGGRPWPESRALRWHRGTGNWPDNPYGIVIVTREQLWGDRWGTDVERGRAYALTGSDVTTWARSPQGARSPQLQFAMASVPHWIVATACALPPLAWLALVVPKRIRQRRRRRLGLCLACGYDLRESPEKCPECGTVPAPKVPA